MIIDTRKNLNTPHALNSGVDIFLTLTPLHQIFVTSLLSSNHFTNSAQIVINMAKKSFEADNVDVINCDFQKRRLVDRISLYRRLARFIKNLLRDDLINSITAPHPNCIICNSLMFANGNHRVNILEDGLGSYYNSKNIGFIKRKSRMHVWQAPILGFSYSDYDGHFSGINVRRMDSGFFLDPSLVYMPERFNKLCKLNLNISSSPPRLDKGHRLLVLDQNIESVLRPEHCKEMRKKMYDYVNSYRSERIILKRHPAIHSGLNVNAFKQRLEEVDPSDAAELTAMVYSPTIVLSFFSSALANIKRMMPHVECIAIMPEKYNKDETALCQIKSCFDNMGVEILR
ncbi:hypothetical protein CWI75_17625 [Kineobactrum sediminis]|uniref:Uncharacterized protein n=1 Tax=Kineobactrum sediminis TaxID=1905677 RepID=A0A2N5XXX0_9GAMM|nr:hypothetical protein [Kineobactrum sediminis]PLW80998.1 hypothetical protein CWI75_17625 [Kineobactrum sediminis]